MLLSLGGTRQKMSAEIKKEIQLEIAHVLFIDIVRYSTLSINEQGAVVDELSEVVRSSGQYRMAEAAGRFVVASTSRPDEMPLSERIGSHGLSNDREIKDLKPMWDSL
jgi:hypothetical protein